MGGDRMSTRIQVMLAMTMALLSIQIAPTSAQSTDVVGPCWPKITTCIRTNLENNKTNPEPDREKLFCCPLIQQTAVHDKQCFCSIGTVLHEPDTAHFINILIGCGVTSNLPAFDVFCSGSTPPSPAQSPPVLPPSPPPAGLGPSPPVTTPSTSPPSLNTPSPAQAPAMSPMADNEDDETMCWKDILSCFLGHAEQRETNPVFNPRSPLFNRTEALCCPLIHKTLLNNKPCFCQVNSPIVHQHPQNFTLPLTLLAGCQVADSLASLDTLCEESTPSPSTSPTISPPGLAPEPSETPELLSPPAGVSAPNSPASASDTAPSTEPSNKTAAEPPKNASFKISMMGPFSSILILLTYFFCY